MQASLGWQGCQACGDFCSFARSFRAGGRVRLLRWLTCWAVVAPVAPACRVGLLWHLRARLSCRAAVVPAVVALLRAVAACRDYRNLTVSNKKNGIPSKLAAIAEQLPGSQQQKAAPLQSKLRPPRKPRGQQQNSAFVQRMPKSLRDARPDRPVLAAAPRLTPAPAWRSFTVYIIARK